MKTKFSIKSLVLGTLLVCQPVFAVTTVYEDFSGGATNAAKSWDSGGSVVLDTDAENLVLNTTARSFMAASSRTRIRLQDSAALTLKADIGIKEYTIGNPDTQSVGAGLAGIFYNSQFATPSDDRGEILVRLWLGDIGNGLEVIYSISEGQNSEGAQYDTVVFGKLDVPGLQLNTLYTATITYDGDNSFVFEFNGVNSASVDGPARVGGARYEQRSIDAGISFGRVLSTEDPNDFDVDDGSVSTITSFADNVMTENGLVDDFSGSALNSAAWIDGEQSSTVTSESLVLKAISSDSTTQKSSWSVTKGQQYDYLGATTTLLGTSTQNDSTRVQARIGGYWYNDTYDTASTGNGLQGDVWGTMQIERNAGTMRATMNLWREDPDHPDKGTEVTWQKLPGSFEMDKAYDLAIEKTDTSLKFYIDGVVAYEYVITTGIYPVKGGEYKTLRAEVRGAAGEAHVRFDDVIIDLAPPSITLSGTDENNAKVDLPATPNVHESEAVTLTADVDDPSQIAAFIWEQTSGDEVAIASYNRPGTALRIVTSDQSITFTVPNGTNGESLGFKVTVVDNNGSESTQDVSFRVDNSVTSTLNPSATVTGGGDSGGGGGSLPPLMLLLLLSVLLLPRSKGLNPEG